MKKFKNVPTFFQFFSGFFLEVLKITSLELRLEGL